MSGLSFGDFSFPQLLRPPPPLRTFINHASINLTEYYIETLNNVNMYTEVFRRKYESLQKIEMIALVFFAVKVIISSREH